MLLNLVSYEYSFFKLIYLFWKSYSDRDIERGHLLCAGILPRGLQPLGLIQVKARSQSFISFSLVDGSNSAPWDMTGHSWHAHF